jgi:hypothetical protein
MIGGATWSAAVLKYVQPTLLMLVPMIFSATLASAQPKEVVREQITLRGTVEAVDHTARTVRIRGDRGAIVTVDVPTSVVPFDQVQVGDVVSVAYYDRVSVRLKPAGEAAVDRTEPPVATATPGTLPGATVASQRVTTVTITSWDPAARVVTFTGPAGTTYSRRLLDSTDASIMAGIKVGDRVDVTRTEAARFAVESRTSVNVTATDTLRDRLTFSVLWGLDNQFSGHMIKSATGQTTTGVPINMNETNYDDVYGRMGIFKIGVGYRTTPRTEGVLNFVLSRSAADRVSVGTAGAAATPLYVDFEDFSYWGVEGGQRFFFARVRFTPYVGYLVGLNRYGDIKGTFVDVPLNVTPGLAAQDGKFFEKSWALSLGPTGGFLIGLGPFEIMAETQMRFMGGLSDVDWLVEEGLRDINDESSRWSFPFQIGARIRF